MPLHRRKFVSAALAAAVAARRARADQASPRRDVPWLDEIQRPPAALPADAPQLAPLVDPARPWPEQAQRIKTRWQDFLGLLPRRDQPPRLQVLREDRQSGVLRHLVRYENEPGEATEAYLLAPLNASGKQPGVVVLHSTSDDTIRQGAGLGTEPEKAWGLGLAQRGIVAICPRNFLWPQSGPLRARQRAEEFLRRRPGSKGMAKMLFDAQRAVDVLAGLPNVDARRLGAAGHSLGAKQALYLAALDERIRAAVSSEGGIGLRFSNWNDPWYLGRAIDEPGFDLEHHQLLALVAPRAFLLVGGQSADGDRGWPFIAAALPVYHQFGRPARLGQYNHRQGHAVPPAAERRIYQWLETYLA